MSPDKNVEAVRAKLLERSQVGLAKYGVTTERTDTDLVGWLNHLQQELMDAAVYVQRSMVEVDTKAQIAELESLRAENAMLKSSGIDKVVKIIAETEVWKELESLRAWKAEIEKQEPVGEVTGYSTAGMYDQFLPGTKLFAAPVVSQQVRPLPFVILPNEMADLERFHECAMDDEGYDVPKARMKRLAEIGLVRRVSANYYEHTTFGLSVLNGDFAAPVVSPDVDALKAEIAQWKANSRENRLIAEQ